VLVEVAAEGAREIECGVLQALDPTGALETSVPAEIRITGEHEFYDFAAKYLPEEATELDVPAKLPDDVTREIRSLSARAFEAVGCEGLARVDFFLMPDGSLVVNEINTMPGFTPLSMFPRMWAATGLDYGQLVDRLIQLALARDIGLR
jgi:D-alanine-D-alanine ligase